MPVFKHDADRIGRALSIERLGGVSLINICGEGETLLPPEIVGIIRSLLECGHYVMVVTNGTVSKRFDEIADISANCLDRLLIKFSFHYSELLRKGWIDAFFSNVWKIKSAGASISVELTPCDDLVPHIADILLLCKKRVGAPCHVTVARDERDPALPILTRYPRADYESIWGRFQSDLFGFKMNVFGQKRNEFCYAGLWSGVLDLVTGQLKQCYSGSKLQNIFEDTECPIRFTPLGPHCQQPHCYNAHAFMTLGVIPSVACPRFAEMRNRICDDGSEWLRPAMKDFLGGRLADENPAASWMERQRCEMRNAWRKSGVYSKCQSLLKS